MPCKKSPTPPAARYRLVYPSRAANSSNRRSIAARRRSIEVSRAATRDTRSGAGSTTRSTVALPGKSAAFAQTVAHAERRRQAARRGADRVIGRYLRSAKNDMVKGFYAGFDFEQIEAADNGDTVWALAPSAYAPRTVFMTPAGAGI